MCDQNALYIVISNVMGVQRECVDLGEVGKVGPNRACLFTCCGGGGGGGVCALVCCTYTYTTPLCSLPCLPCLSGERGQGEGGGQVKVMGRAGLLGSG